MNKTEGNVTINCYGVSPQIVKRLEQLLDINELELKQKGVDLIKAQKEIDRWLNKYNELKNQLAQRPATDELAVKANVLLRAGDLEGAEKLLKKSLAQNLAKRAQLAKEKELLDQSAAKDASDLGLIKELQLDYPAARDYFELAVSIAPKHTIYLNQAGLIYIRIANLKKNLGWVGAFLATDNTYRDANPLGEYQKAIAYFEQALASDLNTYGETHPNVIVYRNNLGSTWSLLREYQKAVVYFEQALLTAEKRLGENHPDTELVRNNLATAREKLTYIETN